MDKKELLSMLGGLYLQRETIDSQIEKIKIDLLLLQKAKQQKEKDDS